jgi:hypothetical protein
MENDLYSKSDSKIPARLYNEVLDVLLASERTFRSNSLLSHVEFQNG